MNNHHEFCFAGLVTLAMWFQASQATGTRIRLFSDPIDLALR